MASTESNQQQSLPFLDEHDNLDILVELFGDGNFDDNNSCYVNTDDFATIFESWSTSSSSDCDLMKPQPTAESTKSQSCVSTPPTPLPCPPVQPAQPVICEETKKPTVFKSPSTDHSISKKTLYRQGAISRWLVKRERRVFLRRVAPRGGGNGRAVPNRSNSNGRFIKSTRGFVSITKVQPSCTPIDDDYASQVFGAN